MRGEWVMLRFSRQAIQNHTLEKVYRFGCPCRDDCHRGCRTKRRAEVTGVVRYREETIRKLVKKPGAVDQSRFCTGYELYRKLTALGARCAAVAPTLVPVNSGDGVKADRRDTLELARNLPRREMRPCNIGWSRPCERTYTGRAWAPLCANGKVPSAKK
jgi:hypothetical protein